MIINTADLVKLLSDAELAHVSADFWLNYEYPPALRDIDPHNQIWAELRAFQYGWARCKEYYGVDYGPGTQTSSN